MKFCIMMASSILIAAAGVCAEPIHQVLLPVAGSEIITFRIQFAVGAINDPAGAEGLTHLTASMMTDAGTASRSYEEITKTLYPMAARVRAQVDQEVTTIIGEVHADHLEDFYSLLIEMIREPGFRAEDFERLHANQMNYLTSTLRTSNDEDFGKEALASLMYDGHPYGRPVAGRTSALATINVERVRSHHRAMFTRGNVTIGLAGGFDDVLVQRLQSDLDQLPEGAPPVLDLPAPRPPKAMPVIAVEKPGRATAISMGFPINVTRASDDFYALLLANSYLGEHRTFNGRLMIRMRQVRGLNYGDYSYIENFMQEGGSTFPLPNIPRRQQFFSIWIRPVQNEHRHFAIRLAMFELEKLVREGISEEDFQATRQFLLNYSRLWAQSQSRRLGYLMDARFYNAEDIVDALPAHLSRMTRDDVNQAVRRHLDFRNMYIAVITSDADAFMNALISNVASPIEYDSDTMADDILAEDRAVSVYRLHINGVDSRVTLAEDMFN